MSQNKPVLLTGIRASGDIHLGNYLGAIQPALKLQASHDAFFFVADLHGLTTNPPAETLKNNIRKIAAAWLACGLDVNQSVLWKQSDVKEHVELSYILSCVTSMGLLERAHSYKDALAKSKVVKVGLFYYPVLMAADILLYNADFVPVGKDQVQHLEMARDIATFFNETYTPTFNSPKALVQDDVAIVPGIDGRKMSKSYDNGIDLFADEKVLKKQIMAIKTDSKGLDDPKIANECTVFQLYKLIATSSEAQTMKTKLEAGGFGYGDAKKMLLSKILDGYAAARNEYSRWIGAPSELDEVLSRGAEIARGRAAKIMSQVKRAIGL